MKKYADAYRYSFEYGAEVSEEYIQECHKDIFKFLKEHKKQTWNVRQTGRSLVIGIKSGEGDITIFECRNGYTQIEYEKLNKNS
jgi:hypothetical protein